MRKSTCFSLSKNICLCGSVRLKSRNTFSFGFLFNQASAFINDNSSLQPGSARFIDCLKLNIPAVRSMDEFNKKVKNPEFWLEKYKNYKKVLPIYMLDTE